MDYIANKIIEVRKLKGLSQEELAEKAQVNLRTIQRIENRENKPREKTLILICDALQIELGKIAETNHSKKTFTYKLINFISLFLFNFSLIGIIGYLTLDSNANTNSRLGALILSITMPTLIVLFTTKISGLERMLKFGAGFITYFFLALIFIGFVNGLTSGLFICLIIATAILYYGENIISPLLVKDK